MLDKFLDWLDHRTGHRGLVHDTLFERIPSGARFRYVTGSMLVFAFVTQTITGLFLWMAYSPSSTTAYESVYYIQHEMTGGWLLRGIPAHIAPGRSDDYFWPVQVMYDALACLVLLTIVMLLVVHFDLPGVFKGHLPHAHRGAELGAPADGAEPYAAARPEWYYLFLFQLLKYFPGSSEIIGAIVIPTVVVVLLFLLPVVGWWNLGHQISRLFVVLLIAAAGVLTSLALIDDYYAWLAPKLNLKDEKKLTASREFL